MKLSLLEILEASQEIINVFDLSASVGKDFGETSTSSVESLPASCVFANNASC